MASTINASTSSGLVTTADTSGVLTLQSANTNVVNIDATSGNPRITGDYSNATVANRVMFQTSTTNDNTTISFIPNGTGSQSFLSLFNNSDPSNSSLGLIASRAATFEIAATKSGTGSYLPMTFYTNASERLRIDTSGNVLNTGGGGLGYGTGSGGTVTQATSKTTGVTINKTTGQITMNNAALGAGLTAQFTVTNSTVAVGDIVVATHCSGGTLGNYFVRVFAVGNGSFIINIVNASAGSLSDAVVIAFAVIKGASS